MTDKIGKLKSQVQLAYRKFSENKEGDFEEKYHYGEILWAQVVAMAFKKRFESNEKQGLTKEDRLYKVTMRKMDNWDALQANLFGLRFKSKVHKIISPFVELHSWVEGLVSGE